MTFAVYLIYITLTYIRIDAFVPELAAYRPMLILGLLSFSLALVQAMRRKELAAKGRHLGLLALLAFSVAASQLTNLNVGAALESVDRFLPSAMILVMGCLNMTTLKRVRLTSSVIVLCTVGLCTLSVVSYHTGFLADQLVLAQGGSPTQGNEGPAHLNVVPADDTSGETFWRVRSVGFLFDPNDFAQAAVVALCLLFGAYAPGRHFRNLFVVGLPTALLGYTIYLTHSRGAIVGLAIILLVGLREKLGSILTAGLLGVLGIASFVSDFSGGRGFSSQEASAQDRIAMWDNGIHMFLSHPLFGVGFGDFIDTAALTAHNSFVLCFAELGGIGFFAWMGLLVTAFQSVNRLRASAPAGTDERKWASLLRSALLGYITCAWFLSRTYTPDLYIVLSLCFAMGYCGRHQFPERSTASEKGGESWVSATILACTLAFFGVYGFVVYSRMTGGGG